MNDLDNSIEQEHEALLQFVYMAPVGLVQARLDGEVLMINPLAAQLMMPLVGDGSLSNLFDVLRALAPDLQHRLAAHPEPYGLVCDGLQLPALTGTAADGKTREQRLLSLSLLKLDAERIMAMVQDVTWQVKRERLLRQQDAWLHTILNGVADYAMLGLDKKGRVCEWNQSVKRVTGFDKDAALGQPLSIFYPSGSITDERVQDRLREADHCGWSMDDSWRARADGSRFWGSAMIAPLHAFDDGQLASTDLQLDGETHYCLIVRDMTEHRDAAEQARKATVCDHLTGIANRRAFFEAGEAEFGRLRHLPRPLSVVVLDADHFKHINDHHGHAAGDAVLRHIAQTMSQCFRQVDVVARIGGEEFAVLLPSTDLAAAAGVAERVRLALANTSATYEGQTIACTASLGVATADAHTCNLEALLRSADRALYAAKAAGRNTVRCHVLAPAADALADSAARPELKPAAALAEVPAELSI
jgi:diguanylate cyclase (GGDEF)-like protein/PAS domain S-box-containing protein